MIIVVIDDDPTGSQTVNNCFLLLKWDYSTLVKGFAVGRSIFGEIAKDWFSDRLTDAESVRLMAENFQLLCDKWNFVSQHRPEA